MPPTSANWMIGPHISGLDLTDQLDLAEEERPAQVRQSDDARRALCVGGFAIGRQRRHGVHDRGFVERPLDVCAQGRIGSIGIVVGDLGEVVRGALAEVKPPFCAGSVER